mmetsp:Transcript_16698/g.53314  ORF Transcript_16698/g.53314 Transcript_16698/m.53314 type:complete len:208 (+) Transcript_16698:326-949(+)
MRRCWCWCWCRRWCSCGCCCRWRSLNASCWANAWHDGRNRCRRRCQRLGGRSLRLRGTGLLSWRNASCGSRRRLGSRRRAGQRSVGALCRQLLCPGCDHGSRGYNAWATNVAVAATAQLRVRRLGRLAGGSGRCGGCSCRGSWPLRILGLLPLEKRCLCRCRTKKCCDSSAGGRHGRPSNKASAGWYASPTRNTSATGGAVRQVARS